MAEIAARQHGVAATRQLLAAGLTREGISRRAQAGRLHRVHQGVYAVGHPGLSVEGRWMAAVLACGNRVPDTDAGDEAQTATSILKHWGAVLSHRSAAGLWRLLPAATGPAYVSVAGIAGKRRRQGIHLHRSRTLRPEMAISQRGIPVTTPARTIADLRRAAVTRGCPASVTSWELRRAIRQAEVLGLPIGDETSDRTRSDLELAFLRLCRRHDLPEPEVNVWIESLQVDFLWRGSRLVVETDGYRYHRGRAAFGKDRERDLRLRALGYEVIRLSEEQVSGEPARVAEVLRARLETPGV